MKRETWITLYNISHNRDGSSSVYNRTAIFVHLEDVRGSRKSKTSEESLDGMDIFVPFLVEKEIGKKFLEAEQYALKEDKTKVFTFQKDDIVLIGIVEDEVSTETEKQFIIKHPEAVRISDFETNGFGSPAMRHWEVHCGN